MSGPQFIRLQSTGLSGLGEMVESYYKLQPKLKQFPSLQMHFSFKKAFDNAVKERQPQLTAGMCVSQRWKFEHVMW